jgi:hypothetical protein
MPFALLLLPLAATAAPLALVGGTVHTVSGSTIENGTVVMDHGRITAVGAGITPPADAQVVSVSGKHVYPGFVSANSVLGLTEIESVRGTNDFEETGNVNPNIRSEVEINPSSDLIPVARVNGITTALVVPQGGAISGTSSLVHLVGWTWEDMLLKAPVAMQVNWPNMTPIHAWFIRQSDEEQKKARDEAIENIKKSFDDARAYWTARGAEGKAGVPRHDEDVKWDAMGKALSGQIPVIVRAQKLAQIRAALKFADDEKLGAPLGSVRRQLQRPREAPGCRDPVLHLGRREHVRRHELAQPAVQRGDGRSVRAVARGRAEERDAVAGADPRHGRSAGLDRDRQDRRPDRDQRRPARDHDHGRAGVHQR